MNSSDFQTPPVVRHPGVFGASAIAHPYHLSDPGWPDLWDFTGGGEGIKIGVADTGVDPQHPELLDALVDARDFTGSRRSAMDFDGHGTHTSSTIVGRSVGLAPKAKLYHAKVLGDNGRGSDLTVAAGIRWLVDCGCQIISLSLGSPQPSRIIQAAVRAARDAGVLVFAASGNEGASESSCPACFDDCVASVGAVDQSFNLARFSNRGISVDVVGYGVEVVAAVPHGAYQAMSGTSMATPYVAGVAANRLSAELRHRGRLMTTHFGQLRSYTDDVKDLGAVGRDDKFGWGFPDAAKVVRRNLATDAEPPAPDLEPIPEPEPKPPIYSIDNLALRGEVNGISGRLKLHFEPDQIAQPIGQTAEGYNVFFSGKLKEV
ncbi:MAG: S8 family serine peptidase [Blastopirellula sp. JB062]